MRIQQILDDLHALVERSGRIPGLRKKAVDERRFYALLGHLREEFPAELRQATRIIQDRDKIVAEAQAKAEEIQAEAQRAAARLVEESEIIRQAKAEADEVIRSVQAEAQQIRNEAHAYARLVLESIDSMVGRIAATVEAGRAALASPEPTEPPETPHGSHPAGG